VGNVCPYLSKTRIMQVFLTSGNVIYEPQPTPVQCIETQCSFWNTDFDDCVHNALYKLLKHMHQHHWHQYTHECPEIEGLPCGEDNISSELSLVGILMCEWYGNQDLDRNGLIYGKHFLIDPDDPECPETLNLGFRENFEATVKTTWAKYKSTVNVQ